MRQSDQKLKYDGFDLRKLYYFVKAAEAGTLVKAGEELYVSQPALGRQIKDLDNFFGTRLIEFRNRRVCLTPQGRILKAEADVIFRLVDKTIERVREATP